MRTLIVHDSFHWQTEVPLINCCRRLGDKWRGADFVHGEINYGLPFLNRCGCKLFVEAFLSFDVFMKVCHLFIFDQHSVCLRKNDSLINWKCLFWSKTMGSVIVTSWLLDRYFVRKFMFLPTQLKIPNLFRSVNIVTITRIKDTNIQNHQLLSSHLTFLFSINFILPLQHSWSS